MSDAIPDLSSDLGFDREAIEVARRSAFAVATHRPEDFEGMRKAGRIAHSRIRGLGFKAKSPPKGQHSMRLHT